KSLYSPLCWTLGGHGQQPSDTAIDQNKDRRQKLWQNHLNYPGSSALAITKRQHRLKRTSNGTILGLSGNIPIQPPVLGSNKHTPHEGESRDITTTIFLHHRHKSYYNPVLKH